MLSARSAEQRTEAEAELGRSGAEVAAYAADVSKPDEAAKLVLAAVTAIAASTSWSTMSAAGAEERGSPTAPTTIGAMRWSGI
jgi:hypothetical protein